ncbi:hypothetical protein DKG75_04235 [Zavarzinia compransoris]|uniref:Uncharacterized protein n=1 Tax=Zavarzinia compransoris TaxID=1264899 RepID=A0A317E9J6_9PROT|nr:hypothetical protein DKG75_04235 [Zavarzinia compransoris]
MLLGFAVAPGAAALMMAVDEALPRNMTPGQFWRSVQLVAVFAYPPALLLGFPAVVAFGHIKANRPALCGIAGAGIAAAPWLLLFLFGGSNTGWMETGMIVVRAAAYGFGAGMIFWLIVDGPWRRRQAAAPAP